MSSEQTSQKALFTAVYKLMRPLIRVLLRNGVPYGAFTDIAKRAYIDVAMKEFGVPHKKQTNSRVATITGIPRKEIHRVLALPLDEAVDPDSLVRYNRAARVVYGWVHDKTYADANGESAVLAFEGESPSFSSLVKTYSGDVPPRAILDELLQVGIAERDNNGNIKLLERAYIPTKGEAEKLTLLGRDVAGLISTMDRNIHGAPGAPFFQRKVFYDNVSDQAAMEFRRILLSRGQPFLEEFDRWLSQRDRDVNPHAEGSGRKAIGVGLYYFEEDVQEDNIQQITPESET
jgi:hypothetical protein